MEPRLLMEALIPIGCLILRGSLALPRALTPGHLVMGAAMTRGIPPEGADMKHTLLLSCVFLAGGFPL